MPFYHEVWLPSIEDRFKSDNPLCSLDDAVTAARKGVGDQRSDPSPGGTGVSGPQLQPTSKVTGTL